jgi:hypothetical protein
MTLTSRNVTKNQATFDTDRSKLLVFGNSFVKDATYRNVSGDVESVAEGQIMGKIAASGKWTVCKSGASDGSQIPRGIFLDTLTEIADSTDVSYVNIVNGGKVNAAKLVFNGTDTLDTLVGGVRMEDLLIANSKDLELATINDDSINDN